METFAYLCMSLFFLTATGVLIGLFYPWMRDALRRLE